MSIRELVTQEINRLEEPELKQVADYVAFLKFQSRNRALPSSDSSQWAALYAEFADEDRAMAEAGIAEYAIGLAREDAA